MTYSNNNFFKKKKKNRLVTYINKNIIVDTIYKNNKTMFLVFDKKIKWIKTESELVLSGKKYVPIKNKDKLIKSWSLVFPSEIKDYWTKNDLYNDIVSYIDKYVDVPEEYVYISAYYIMFTYFYNNFSELPYLRTLWDYWSWKSRLLKVIWHICFNPIMLWWWASLAAIFRLIDKFKGTLVIDEADFSNSSTTEWIIKVLNTGYQTWNPIVRVEWEDFEVNCFDVYWPKIIWWRNEFSDRATESRCLTNFMKRTKRKDIPTSLDKNFQKEALELRNKLLKFRYDYIDEMVIDSNIKIDWVEPRLKQIILPLLSIVEDKDMQNLIIDFLRKKQQEIREDRKNDNFWWILMIIKTQFEKWTEVSYSRILEDFYISDGISLKPIRLWYLFKENGIKAVRKSEWKVIRYEDNKNTLERLYKEYSIII